MYILNVKNTLLFLVEELKYGGLTARALWKGGLTGGHVKSVLTWLKTMKQRKIY